MSHKGPDATPGGLNVSMTLFAVEYGDTVEEPGYIVRFRAEDKPSMARLGGMLFSMPEGAVRHLMNNVWWLREESMEYLVHCIPSLGTQIARLASGEETLL
jgi:hypothetical protein